MKIKLIVTAIAVFFAAAAHSAGPQMRGKAALDGSLIAQHPTTKARCSSTDLH